MATGITGAMGVANEEKWATEDRAWGVNDDDDDDDDGGGDDGGGDEPAAEEEEGGGDEEEGAIHHCCSVKHGGHENVVARAVDE